jgi:hypothetical protein
MNDPELKAITEVAKALADLTDEQRHNVLVYVNTRYGGRIPAGVRAGPAQEVEAVSAEQFDSIGDLFDAADPQTESNKVLVAAYWTQVVEKAEDFESYPVNQQLKNLGHPVSNITRALDTMQAQSPRLVRQTSKSGSSKQARKRYRITREGIKYVQAMVGRAQEK